MQIINKIKFLRLIVVATVSLIGVSNSYCQCIIPLEELYNSDIEEEDNCYVKDINHLLDTYVGSWKGTFGDNKLFVNIQKETINTDEFRIDILVLRYKITNASNNITENTFGIPRTSKLICEGDYFTKDNTWYLFGYKGRSSSCGQSGEIFVRYKNQDPTKLYFFLSPNAPWASDPNYCSTGIENQILPTKLTILVKQ
ncbi:hypothetical protein ACXGQW_07875 [Wenyingzhuangia sp. IMCC45533]